MNKILSNPIAITVSAIIAIVVVALLGKKYWGWFSKPSTPAISTTVPPATSAPDTIGFAPTHVQCETYAMYTVANPYQYMGCSYIYSGFTNGKCILRKNSCP